MKVRKKSNIENIIVSKKSINNKKIKFVRNKK